MDLMQLSVIVHQNVRTCHLATTMLLPSDTLNNAKLNTISGQSILVFGVRFDQLTSFSVYVC